MFTLQLASGAFSAELSTPDEPAHFVTALMIRDYVRAGIRSDPITFATQYYLHYPKVAFGHWPPVFHIIAAAWMWAFSASRVAILSLLALVTSLLAAAVYRRGRDEWCTAAAAATTALFVALPVTQYVTNRVLADGLVGAFAFWAMVQWARFLDGRRTKDSVAFGSLGALAMLTKGNGLAVLAVPFLSVALSGEWGLLRKRSFWYGPAIMVMLGAPWQVITWR